MPGARACCKPAGRALGDGHQAWRSGCSGGGIWQVVAGDHRGPGWFNDPASAALDVQGNLYVADMGNNRIQTLSPDGQPVAKWGTRGGAPG